MFNSQIRMTKKQKLAIYHNVDKFLKYDFPIIHRRSGECIGSSINFDGMPKAINKQNNNELAMIEHATYSIANKAVLEAIKGCSKESQLIIDWRYIKQTSNYQLKCRLGIYGNEALYRRIYKACIEFADCLETTCIQLHVDPNVIHKLNVI